MSAILDKLRADGYVTMPEEFYRYIDAWKQWYIGNVDKFHTYKIWNGRSHISCHRYGLGMGKKVCEDWASLLLNEKVHVTLEGEAEQEFVDDIFHRNNFEVKGNEMQELKAAFGTAAYVTRVTGVAVGEDGQAGTGEAIKIDYVTADKIYPLAWENGIISECAFATELSENDDKYIYLQIHSKNGQGNYDITNKIFRNTNGELAEVSLSELDQFAKVSPVVHTNSNKKLFIIDRMNIANSIDPSLPMGISIFANAIDQLKGCDIAYDGYVNEFNLGKKRIMVKPEATKDFDGNPFFDPDDLAFYMLPEDSQSGNVVQEINMSLRSAEFNSGIQDMLNALSAKCGFGENHYRFDNGSVSTATQIISQNSSLFRNVKKHEIILEDVLIDLCRTILHLGNTYLGQHLNEDVEISVDFDDSIIEDKATDFARDMQMLNMGIMQRYEFRMRWMNEDEETAKAALPQMESLVEEV